ncbi:Translocon-associated protein (TRAP), alpha subunit [Novymonas esmeraldas]|uniref:Translocon-associated protein (TRAP), alpha subunit n=1 Tax=Novymonas esmeraldas TaxID=1808958 RepID=A0AAW0EU58_9TRYP
MSRGLRKWLFLAAVALLIASVALADVVPSDDADDGITGGATAAAAAAAAEEVEVEDLYAGADADAGRVPYVSRVFFVNASSQSFPSFPAGSKANAVVAFQNNDNAASQVVFLVAGMLQPPQQYHMTLQNFSAVRQAREVKKDETVSMQYTFTPDARLEPGEYNMVIILYLQDSATNQTYFVTAFNSTIMLEDPLGTDPRTVLTYFTLLAIFGGVAYVAADKLGLVKVVKALLRSKNGSGSGAAAGRSGSSAKNIELGTSGASYDPAYINAEHQRYRDEVLRQKSASPHPRQKSASPNKKKN